MYGTPADRVLNVEYLFNDACTALCRRCWLSSNDNLYQAASLSSNDNLYQAASLSSNDNLYQAASLSSNDNLYHAASLSGTKTNLHMCKPLAKSNNRVVNVTCLNGTCALSRFQDVVKTHKEMFEKLSFPKLNVTQLLQSKSILDFDRYCPKAFSLILVAVQKHSR